MIILFKNKLNNKQIKEINNHIESNYDRTDVNTKGAKTLDGKLLKNVKVYQITWGKIKKYLHGCYQGALYHINRDFGFDTFEMNDNVFINLNVYDHKDKSDYGYHVDAQDITSNWDIKSTILINVSQKKYEGGDFKYFFNGEEHKVDLFNKPGNMIVLRPWVFHKVEPVTKGERRTLAIFVGGPKWR